MGCIRSNLFTVFKITLNNVVEKFAKKKFTSFFAKMHQRKVAYKKSGIQIVINAENI